MQILILSDLHLTKRFSKKKFNFLKNLIDSYDNIIINGDLWSINSITFNQFIKSKWNKLFPLLKEKNTTYIYGNHDRNKYMDDRMKLFSNKQSEKEIIEINGIKYIIEHGDKILKKKSIENYIYIFITRLIKIDAIFRYPLEILLTILFGIKKYNEIPKYQTKDIKEYTAKSLRDNEMLIIGHIHSPEINYEHRYACSGIIGYGHAQYLILNKQGIELKHERYR